MPLCTAKAEESHGNQRAQLNAQTSSEIFVGFTPPHLATADSAFGIVIVIAIAIATDIDIDMSIAIAFAIVSDVAADAGGGDGGGGGGGGGEENIGVAAAAASDVILGVVVQVETGSKT